MKNTARNKQIVFFAESRKTVKLKLFLAKAKKGHSGEFLDIFEIGQIFMSIRSYDSTQTNHRKNLSSLFVRKSNSKIINIFGREILKSGSGRKTLSKRHRPKTGRAARWELISYIKLKAGMDFGI